MHTDQRVWSIHKYLLPSIVSLIAVFIVRFQLAKGIMLANAIWAMSMIHPCMLPASVSQPVTAFQRKLNPCCTDVALYFTVFLRNALYCIALDCIALYCTDALCFTVSLYSTVALYCTVKLHWSSVLRCVIKCRVDFDGEAEKTVFLCISTFDGPY